MKRFLFIMLILLLPSVFAISTDIKDTYQQGETLITKIHGNVLELIKKEDIELKRKNVQIPFEYDVKKIGSDYYLYAIVPYSENEFTLRVKDIETTKNGIPVIETYEKNFSTTSEIVPYSVKPGFFITSSDLEITITLNKDQDETIQTDFPEEKFLVLKPGENKISIPASDPSIEAGFRVITIGAYSLPVFILPKPEINMKEKILFLPEFRFFPNTIDSIILIEEEPVYPFLLVNTGHEPITTIALEFNQDLFEITPQEIQFLDINETQELNLVLKTKQPVYDTITAKSGDLEIKLTINISFTENEEDVKTPYLEEDYQETQGYYCSQLNGKTCLGEEICPITTIKTIDSANCCLAECSSPEKESKTSAIIGYSIGIFLLLILIFLVIKYRKTQRQENPLNKNLSKIKK